MGAGTVDEIDLPGARRWRYSSRDFVGHVCIPILLGGAIYLGWRSPHLAVHHWMHAVGLGGATAALRAGAARIALPPFIKFSVPDALWCYALVAHIGRLWRGTTSGRAWILIAVAASLLSEVGQLVGVVPGTFDISDLLAVAGACSVALLFLFTPRRTPVWNAPATF